MLSNHDIALCGRGDFVQVERCISSFWRHLVTPLLGLENIIYGFGQKEVFWQKSIMSKKDKVNFC